MRPAGEVVSAQGSARLSGQFRPESAMTRYRRQRPRPRHRRHRSGTRVYLGRAVKALRRRGAAAPDALLAHLAPLGWQHVNLTGDYSRGAGGSFGPDSFRSLRGSPHALADAA
jgi:hypothetical protein